MFAFNRMFISIFGVQKYYNYRFYAVKVFKECAMNVSLGLNPLGNRFVTNGAVPLFQYEPGAG